MLSQTLPDLRNLRRAIFNKIKKKRNNIFETRSDHLIAVTKAQWDECGGRILLGDNTGGGAAMGCGRSVPSVLDFGFQLDYLDWQCLCSMATCAEFDWSRAFRSVTIALGNVSIWIQITCRHHVHILFSETRCPQKPSKPISNDTHKKFYRIHDYQNLKSLTSHRNNVFAFHVEINVWRHR
jgi:hypothetical protein